VTHPFLTRAKPWLRDLLVVAVIVVGVRAYQQRSLASGVAPPLRAPDLAGREVDLAAYRGKPVIVHFWATWCAMCRAEQHNIDAVARDIPVVTIATDSGTRARVATYVRAHGIEPRVVVDEYGALRSNFGVRAFPTTFVLDAEGRIRHVEVGYTSELGLRARAWLARF